jgi:hypothetical protein
MSWNYRILAFEENDEMVLQICEVYYDNENNPNAYGDKCIVGSTEGKDGLKWLLSKYKEALHKPILYGGDRFPKEYIE